MAEAVFSSESHYLFIKLHGVTYQSSTIFTLDSAQTSNYTQISNSDCRHKLIWFTESVFLYINRARSRKSSTLNANLSTHRCRYVFLELIGVFYFCQSNTSLFSAITTLLIQCRYMFRQITRIWSLRRGSLHKTAT
jgi:hypothetical protein